MPDVLPLIVGTVLAVGALLYVLAPLLRGPGTHARGSYAPELAPEASALEALREIEFDQATGKLSPEDYTTLKATYAPRALAELKAREAAGGAGTADQDVIDGAGVTAGTDATDAAERLIARMKSRGTSCPTHGPRPESDALYCSDCGTYLAGACLRCGATIGDAHSRFCGECGAALAA
jgi:hypothetical protein